MFTDQDLKQIEDHGLSASTVQNQINFFKEGFPPAHLTKPATIGEGILHLKEGDLDNYVKSYESNSNALTVVKFVPASGAASRMFKHLFAFQTAYSGSEEDYQEMIAKTGKGSVFEFFKNLEAFAFYDQLGEKYKSGESVTLSEAHLKRSYVSILDYLLGQKGLNYGKLPKGLLAFHKTGYITRTPVEEHIVEGCQYAKKSDGTVTIHFTVSPEHLVGFKQHVSAVQPRYESEYDCKLQISYSVQNPGTDTIAVDLENKPFVEGNGKILFRPAGHGALLENLDAIDADIIFLKNIDNVVPDNLKPTTITYKKVIGGVLLAIQQQVFQYLQKLETLSDSEIDEVKYFVNKYLGYEVSGDVSKDQLRRILDRPIRVCGMVKNQGEPGGGPFWVKNEQGATSLQIVETAQIDLENKEQHDILQGATHFNPVDVVCAVRNYKGEKFDLIKFRDPSTGFITEKSKDGKTLKAQELPGLWNGSMADWNTIFVEVPIITFNPVKTVNDLIKPEHQG